MYRCVLNMDMKARCTPCFDAVSNNIENVSLYMSVEYIGIFPSLVYSDCRMQGAYTQEILAYLSLMPAI